MPSIQRFATAARLAATLALLSAPAFAAEGATDFSPAERAIFMSDPIGKLHPPTTLHYAFHRSGSLETAFDDEVSIKLTAQADGTCCAAIGEFLTGERRLPLPDVDGAKANPVVLFFLERDVREMQRLTKGQQAYFRKRIRMAIYDGADVHDVKLRYRGAQIAGSEIVIAPYAKDPNRGRFERFADKQYVFTLSDAVPGGIYAIRSRIPDAATGAPPLITDELLIDGAEAGAR